jgi:hypothetical protein
MARQSSFRYVCRAVLVVAAALAATFVLAGTASASETTAQQRAVVAVPLNSGTHCNQDVCMAVDSLNGSGPDITYVSVWMRNHSNSQHLMGNEQVRWYTQPGYNNAPKSLKGMRAGPWTENNNMWPYGAYWSPYLYVTPGYWICGMITGISGYPCITVGN